MTTKPPLLLTSGLTGRAYIVTAYTEGENGVIVADVKHDVTAEVDVIRAEERERIAQTIEADLVRLDDGSLNAFGLGEQHAARIARGAQHRHAAEIKDRDDGGDRG